MCNEVRYLKVDIEVSILDFIFNASQREETLRFIRWERCVFCRALSLYSCRRAIFPLLDDEKICKAVVDCGDQEYLTYLRYARDRTGERV